jgi:hypothetical protein
MNDMRVNEISECTRLMFQSIAVLVTLLLFVAPPIAHAALKRQQMRFSITINDDLQKLAIKSCFDTGAIPSTLIASEALAGRIQNVRAMLTDGSIRNLEIRDRKIDLSDIDASCVHYSVALKRDQTNDWRSGFNHHNGGVVLAFDHFLLRAVGSVVWSTTRLDFSTDHGVQVLAPGKLLLGENGGQSFEFQDRPSNWSGAIAFGELTLKVVRIAEVDVRIAIVGKVSPLVAEKLQTWVATGIDTLTGLYGRIPVPSAQIIVFPLAHNSDPVPWGEVTRGGADAVHLYVDSTRPLGDLTSNWVISHELSHLIHPYLTHSDAWLSEGVASYYQNVLRARAGLIKPQRAWKKLHAGFERGAAQVTHADTLAEDTQEMLDKGRYMRVYWGGAAIAFIADVNFRHQSKGRVSLDSVFDRYSRCCLPSKQRVSAFELMAALDTIAEMDVLVPLYKRYAMTPQFPDLTQSYQKLGITHHTATLAFSETPETRSLRAAIMGK